MFYKSLILEAQLTLNKYRDFIYNFVPVRYRSANFVEFLYSLVNLKHSDSDNEWSDRLHKTARITSQTLVLTNYLYDYFNYSKDDYPLLFMIDNPDQTEYTRQYIYHDYEFKDLTFYKEDEFSYTDIYVYFSKESEKNLYADFTVYVLNSTYGLNIDLIKVRALVNKYIAASMKFEIIEF